MLTNREGQKVPQVTFHTQQDNQWVDITSDELFAGKKVILFALPGAFTPTCSTTHLPRYNELAPVFAKEGIDAIICLSVNDTFVMNAWQTDQQADNITFIPDGSGEFSKGMEMLVNKDVLGFGDRSWRYSMLVVDGVIEKQFIEPDLPGDPFQVSDADTMLEYINPNAEQPAKVSVLTKPGCPHCVRAKKLLTEKGFNFEVIELGSNGVSYSSLTAISGRGTTPQIFINGELIGGADELESYLAS
ncbi:glutathione peroxidase [Amphritea sp. HPY]|uniref:glutathione peroxidase n=1 Tax=Amphritea sp. HPY TaxID=3421652 RepID=UPI003D7D35EE